MPLVLTVDVEDWPQSTLDTSLEITERARRNTEYLLDLLARHRRPVTCFVLGKFADRFPECVRRMAAEGHEVASHGYGHVDVFRQTQAEFRDDVRRSKAQLEALTGRPVAGYRAPDFSVVRESLWALDVLAEEGFAYDASINPATMARFAVTGWPAQPVRLELASGRRLVELPVATAQAFGRRWPVAGGGYHRLLPWPAIRGALARALARGETFVAYCHPYEFDPGELAQLPYRIPLKTRLHQGLGRRGFEAKFRHILGEFNSTLAVTLAQRERWPPYAPSRAAGLRSRAIR